jgi:hypothetical protein
MWSAAGAFAVKVKNDIAASAHTGREGAGIVTAVDVDANAASAVFWTPLSGPSKAINPHSRKVS